MCLHFVHQLITIIIFVSSFHVHIGSSNSWIYDENDFIMPPTWTQSQGHHHSKHQDLWMSWWNDRFLVNQFYYLNTSILLNSPILLRPSFLQKHLVILMLMDLFFNLFHLLSGKLHVIHLSILKPQLPCQWNGWM